MDQLAEGQEQVEGFLAKPKIQWARVALSFAVILAVCLLAARFYKQTYQGLTDRSAMDAAQIARNISKGAGFVTHFLRPFNLALDPGETSRVAEINAGPVYPYLLGWAFRLRAPSDQLVIWVSLLFLGLAIAATYLLGWLLFDWRAGLVSAALFGISLPVLRAATSGSDLTCLVFVTTLLLVAVALHHRAACAAKRTATTAYAAAAATMCAILYMTDYLFVFAVLPVAAYFALTGPFRRLNLAVYLLTVALLVAPCAYRNYAHTGVPLLGIRAWDIMTHTTKYEGDTLLRSTSEAERNPARALLFPVEEFTSFAEKLVRGAADMLGAMIPMLGFAGVAFAVVSMLYRFKSSDANAVRGLLYGLAPLMVLVFAAYGDPSSRVLVFAPAAAVFSSAYLLLLIDTKKLHPFFSRTLIVSFVAIAGLQSVGFLLWGIGTKQPWDKDQLVNNYFATLGAKGARGLLYTDVPWIVAWRTDGLALWLPLRDEDVTVMEAKGLPMQVVILTPECRKYSTDEFWRVLHEVRLWREYVRDPERGVREILKAADVDPKDFPEAPKIIQRRKRQYAISSAISGFVTRMQDPLAADDIQVLLHPDLAYRR